MPQWTDLDGNGVKSIINFYWKQIAVIRSAMNFLSIVDIRRGVGQGCAMSPSYRDRLGHLWNAWISHEYKNN